MKWISKALLISPLHLNLMNLKCTSHYWSEHTFSGRVPGFFQYFTSPSLHSFIRLSTQFVSIKHDFKQSSSATAAMFYIIYSHLSPKSYSSLLCKVHFQLKSVIGYVVCVFHWETKKSPVWLQIVLSCHNMYWLSISIFIAR